MNTKHKIKAFTLNEMIVVLIITSIIVGMAFSVLTMVQKHMYSIQDNFNKNTELDKLEQSLWLDFNRYPKIKYDDLEESLTFSTDIDSISYKFVNDYIIKNVDSFQVQLHQRTFYFDGNSVQNGNIDAIKFEASKVFQSQPLFIFKQNDATLFMN